MTWVVAGSAAIAAVSGKLNADAKARQNQQSADINAAQTRFSPWTNIKPQGDTPQAVDQAGEMLGGAASGGLAGLMMRQKMAQQQQQQPDPLQALYQKQAGQDTPKPGQV